MFSYQERRLKLVIWSTYLEQSSCNYSGNQNPPCFQIPVFCVILSIRYCTDKLVRAFQCKISEKRLTIQIIQIIVLIIPNTHHLLGYYKRDPELKYMGKHFPIGFLSLPPLLPYGQYSSNQHIHHQPGFCAKPYNLIWLKEWSWR